MFHRIIYYILLRRLKRRSAVSLDEIIENLKPFAALHGIQFLKDEFTINEVPSLDRLENNFSKEIVLHKPKIHIRYCDVIEIKYESEFLYILLRSGYYYRLSKWDTEKIYGHLYWK